MCVLPSSTGVKQDRKFENAMTLDQGSWGYRRTATLEDYLTMDELIHTFIITVRYVCMFVHVCVVCVCVCVWCVCVVCVCVCVCDVCVVCVCVCVCVMYVWCMCDVCVVYVRMHVYMCVWFILMCSVCVYGECVTTSAYPSGLF